MVKSLCGESLRERESERNVQNKKGNYLTIYIKFSKLKKKKMKAKKYVQSSKLIDPRFD